MTTTHSSSQQWRQDLAYLLYDTGRLMRRRFSERIADLGMSEAQWRVIGFLNQGQGLTQTELALLLGIQKAPLGEHIDKLETSGLLTRQRDPNDRRVNRLYLTADGQHLGQEMALRFQGFILQLQAAMSKRLWLNLQRTLSQLATRFCSEQTLQALSRISFEHRLHVIGLLSRQLRNQFDNALKTLGFTRSQWMVLSTVIDQEGITQTELGKCLDIPKAPLGQVLDELEHKNWLQRHQDTTDLRQKRLSVAEEARPGITTLIADYHQLHREMGETLGDNDMSMLKKGLSQLRENLLGLSTQNTPVPNTKSARPQQTD